MSEASAAEKWTSEDVTKALRARFSGQEWAILFEVRSGTGYREPVTRTADAIAMNLWPSRGLELHGIEIKVSRSDWTKELAAPEKAESIARFCDRWWLAVGDASIVKPGELPGAWGLLVPRGDKLVAKVEAPKLDPQPLSRAFLASLLRSAQGQLSPEAELERVRIEARQKGVEDGMERARMNGAELVRAVEEFEKASGIKIGPRWEAGNVGKAVRGVLSGDLLTLEKRVQDFEAASGLDLRKPYPMPREIGSAVRMVMDDKHGNLKWRLERARDVMKESLDALEKSLAGKETS